MKRPGFANGRDAIEMSKKILRFRDLRISKDGGNEKEITLNDLEKSIKEFENSRPFNKKKKERRNINTEQNGIIYIDLQNVSQSFGFNFNKNEKKEKKEEKVEIIEEENNQEFDKKMKEIERLIKDEEYRKSLEEEKIR